MTGVDESLRLLGERFVVPAVRHDEVHAGGRGAALKIPCGVGLQGDGFLDEHVQPAIDRSHRLLVVQVVRRGDDDGVEVGVEGPEEPAGPERDAPR